jgi:hypothetical protein
MNAGRILASMALMTVAGVAQAQTSQQTVTFQVNAINQISVAGTPSLTINTATAGSAPTAATASATWAVTTNQSNAKITAELDSDMPTGLTLTVNLQAPGTASSVGATPLAQAAVDVVTGLTKVAAGSLSIGYSLSATTAAGVVSSATRTVTYTITGGV